MARSYLTGTFMGLKTIDPGHREGKVKTYKGLLASQVSIEYQSWVNVLSGDESQTNHT